MNRWVPALRLTGIGFFIVVCILGGTFAGRWLDGKLETTPWLLITGLAVGLITAGYGVYRMLSPLLQDKENDD